MVVLDLTPPKRQRPDRTASTVLVFRSATTKTPQPPNTIAHFAADTNQKALTPFGARRWL
ncbi:hypothetical protein H6F76_09790 [Leptolyngbya sp. FACHB-321]|uniref:hypothetical protein n=1 Tax=Leptolyngbya sp. FACHB-321 TaxID=2692807 RepID=UPI0016884CF9|nr:hypothetical protein [Leptolyngbya sp. FACHB-321]MBD2035316.1 hypothetical protein [Leptolyngbya sp. FACHB-321]